LLNKLRPTGQPIDPDELLRRLEESADTIPDHARVAIQAFIAAPPGEPSTIRELSYLEWEIDGVHLIFDKVKDRQQGLADSTLRFFDHDWDDEEILTDYWRKHLEDVKVRDFLICTAIS
jgi:S-DNA-T family DNA segregation ATPase FtsK/SpoIIIE